MKILVTGGAGFIGSAVVRRLLAESGVSVVNFDALTYAANLDALAAFEGDARYRFEHGNICDGAAVRRAFEMHQPDAVMHLAAESHVDRSIDKPAAFIETNVTGTSVLLEASLAYYRALSSEKQRSFRFHHISTDEVFGSLSPTDAPFTEDTRYDPRSPYSASKASSDHLVMAWHHTFGLPIVLTNCSNNYGPWQFPEKLIPLMIVRGLAGESLPVYGRGENVRDWLFVDDHAEALWQVIKSGEVGRSYNVGGRNEMKNLDVVHAICDLLDDLRPRADGQRRREQVAYVTDRPGHDFRYAIDATRIERELGWTPRETFESGLRRTVQWYLDHQAWWSKLVDEKYKTQRLGLGR